VKKAFRVLPYTDKRYKFVVRGKIGGRWKRKYFAKKNEAETYAEFKNIELVNQGREGAEFPSWLRVMAEHCNELLKARGKTIRDATEHFLAVLEAAEKSCTVPQLVEELLKTKRADGVTEKYLADLKHRLGRFASDFEGRMVASITGPQIQDWLHALKLSPVSRNNFRRVLIVAFNHAIFRGYFAGKNPAETTAKAKEVNSPVGILTVKETAALLNAATEETLPYFAIGCFAGLRPAELSRLDWKDIDLESGLIEVTAKKSKTASRRFVTIQPNLAEWLAPYRLNKGGPISPINERKKLHFIRVAAGVAKSWPHDAMRHSFASYHLAHFKNDAALALQMGHTDTGMIYANYRELVKPKDAALFWSITPSKHAGAKVIAFAR